MKILETLRKLIEHEKSARKIGNQAEAEAFAAKAQELLLKHKLEMTDVEFAEQEREEPVLGEWFSAQEVLDLPRKVLHDNWIGILLMGISEANFCKLLKQRQSNSFTIVGRATDRDTTKAMFIYLSNACIDMAPQEALAFFGPSPIPEFKHPHQRSFISSFKLGFANAIYRRLERKREELKAGASEQGLIRVDQMEKVVAQKFKELFPHTHSDAPARSYNHHGYNAGREYGTKVGINSTLRLGSGS